MLEDELKIHDEELTGLLHQIQQVYKYDFSSYARESLKRRVNRLLNLEKFASVAALQFKVLSDAAYFSYFVEELTVNVTEMFRNPGFFRALRQDVFPILARLPFIRIWHAGCSSGEEVYAMAILLKEAGLLEKSLLYGTDLNPHVLHKAKAGLFHISNMKAYSSNYIQSGGISSLSDYYTVRYEQAFFGEELRSRMVYSIHNLVSDPSFNTFNLILCRNVLIYFNRDLQNSALHLFTKSLAAPGILALGSKETIQHSAVKSSYTYLNKEARIWRKEEATTDTGI